MIVKSLRLRNFRNYAHEYIAFSDKTNVLFGDNAQGKTNVLEAVFLCSTGRSHRTQKDAEIIKFGEDSAVIELELERKGYGDFRIAIEIQRTGGKGVAINGVPQRRAGDLLGTLSCVIFSPEDLSIIKGEPQIRRRFLDIFISQIKPAYYFNLHSYLSALRQRNTLLRQAADNRRLLDTIGAWDAQLADYGAKVMWERLYFIRLLKECAKNNHASITDGRETLRVSYAPSVKTGAGVKFDADDSEDNGSDDIAGVIADDGGDDGAGLPVKRDLESMLRGGFTRLLEQNLQTDLARMSTQYGPHKDDISCALGARNIRLYGSQGQQRTAALALKMAQADVTARETGDVPVLLLDDVMSELDRGRQANITRNMKNAQILLTGTEHSARSESAQSGVPASGARYFRVEGGRITLTPT